MRFATLATTAAAIAAAPFAAQIAGPTMSQDEFLSAVRCAAFSGVTTEDADTGVLKLRLNAEARRQPEEAVRRADLEVAIITREAERANAEGQAAAFLTAQARACQSMQVAASQADGAG